MPSKVIATEPTTCKLITAKATSQRCCWIKAATSSEKPENVVSPPKKPVTSNKRHCGERCGNHSVSAAHLLAGCESQSSPTHPTTTGS